MGGRLWLLLLVGFALALVLALARSADAASEFALELDDGESGEHNVPPGEAVEYKLRIVNNNDDERRFEITIRNSSDLESHTAAKAWWSNDGVRDLSDPDKNTTPSIRISGGESRSGITLRLEAQATALYGWWDIELEGLDQDDPDETTLSLTLRVHIDLLANLSITVAEGGAVNGSVEIDSATSYALELHNSGNRRDTYSLSVADVASGWLAEWETDEVTLEAREKRIVNLTVTAPASVWYSDSDSITLKGRSANDAGVTGTLALTTFVRVENGLLIEPGTPETGVRENEPGGTVAYTLKVTNKWSEPVNFVLQVNGPVGWSQPTSSGDNTIAEYGENTDTRVTVIIPSEASVGGYEIVVKARVADDDDGDWAQTMLTVRVIGNYDLALDLSGDSEILLTAGQPKSLLSFLEVHNRAKVSDLVTITAEWETGGDDWTLVVPGDIALNPDQVKKIVIKVTPPLGSEEEKATLLVTVWSVSDPQVSDEQLISFKVAGVVTPVATIDSITPSQAIKGSDVTFNGSGSDRKGTVVAYRWESSIDGELDTEANFSSNNLSFGHHTITFRVQDNNRVWSDADSESLFIYALPVAIAGDDVTVKPGDTVQFSGAGTDDDGSIVKYEWDFNGDGVYEWSSTDNGRTTNIYNNEGTYTAVLRVTDADDFTSIDNRTIIVKSKENDDKGGIPALSLAAAVAAVAVIALRQRLIR